MEQEGLLLKQILDDYYNNKLVLPSLPDVATRVREAMQDDSKSNRDIAKIIQVDPALTARLIQIANSAIYRTGKKIEDCQVAVSRLGLTVTRNLVMSFATRHVFDSKIPALRDRLRLELEHAGHVAAISHVLASLVPGLQQDKAMLSGLVHNIGVLPILRYTEQYPDIASNLYLLDGVIEKMGARLGKLILKKWKFDSDLVEIPEYVSDWMRDHNDEADYIDIVIVARAISALGTDMEKDNPHLEELPAFNRLSISDRGLAGVVELVRENRNEILSVREMLGS